MYAVVKTGGKQYRVGMGDVICVEKLPGKGGDAVELNDVLLISNGDEVHVGQPNIAGASVNAEILDQGKHRKLLIFKYKRRKRYRRKAGHRQPFTALKITAITEGSSAGEAE